MVGMQNQGNMFYLFKFADLQSHIHHSNSEVFFSPFHHPFVLHTTYEMLHMKTFEVSNINLLAL